MATQRDAERALDLHERELSALPNVVGLGVRPVDGPGPTEYQVAVYVSQKVPNGGLGPGEAIPEVLEVRAGDRAVAVPITVIESGEFTFE